MQGRLRAQQGRKWGEMQNPFVGVLACGQLTPPLGTQVCGVNPITLGFPSPLVALEIHLA